MESTHKLVVLLLEQELQDSIHIEEMRVVDLSLVVSRVPFVHVLVCDFGYEEVLPFPECLRDHLPEAAMEDGVDFRQAQPFLDEALVIDQVDLRLVAGNMSEFL